MSFSMNGIPTTYRNRRDSDSKSWYAKKDKPFYGGVPRGRAAFYRKRRYPLLGIVFFILLFFYVRKSYTPQNSGDLLKHRAEEVDIDNLTKRTRIRDVFIESWTAYSKSAWGKDEFHPVSRTSKNMIKGGMGWIIIDALDTMHIMNLQEPLYAAREWVLHEHTFDVDAEVNVFETTIRMLGGLLSIYHLSQDKRYLDKAQDLGDRLLGAYETMSGIPTASVNLKTRKGVKSHDDMGASSTAEVASLQLEMQYLSHATKDPKYGTAAERVMARLRQNDQEGGLVPIFVNSETGAYQGNEIRLGSRGDSYYEYLAKQWLLLDSIVYKNEYEKAVAGIKKYLVAKSYPNGLTYVGEKHAGVTAPTDPKMDHLVCFLPGTLALGATRGRPYKVAKSSSWWTAKQDEDMDLAAELTRSCYEMYNATTTGLAPEIVFFNDNPDNPSDTSLIPDIHIHERDRHNLMRPETVESLFVMWRITREEKYRIWAWKIFLAFEKHLHVGADQGYTSIENVMQSPPEARDNMESFWLAETLKYLYLIFDNDETSLGLDEIIFNTEAHIFPIFSKAQSASPQNPKMIEKDEKSSKPRQKWELMQESVEAKISHDDHVRQESEAQRETRYRLLKEAHIAKKAIAAKERAVAQGKTPQEANNIEEAVRAALEDTVTLEQLGVMQDEADNAILAPPGAPPGALPMNKMRSGAGGMGAKFNPMA